MDTMLPWVQIGSILLSVLIMWLSVSGKLGIAAGRALQQQDIDTAAVRELQQTIREHATTFQQKLDSEHTQRRAVVSALDVNMGRLSERVLKIEIQVDHLEKRADIVDERLARWHWRRSDGPA